MFSVIMAAYNAEKYISQTLDSLICQSFRDWECLIVVNGSTDSTEDISNSYSKRDHRIKVLKLGFANKSCALNRAIISCNTPLISILDADDLWHPDKLAVQVDMMKNSSFDILGTQMSYIDDQGNTRGEAPFLPLRHEDCLQWLTTKSNPIANSSVVYKRQIHDIVGYYDPEKFAVEDYDMWMRSARARLRMGNCRESLLMHRIHSSSNYNSTNRQQRMKNLVDATNDFYLHLHQGT